MSADSRLQLRCFSYKFAIWDTPLSLASVNGITEWMLIMFETCDCPDSFVNINRLSRKKLSKKITMRLLRIKQKRCFEKRSNPPSWIALALLLPVILMSPDSFALDFETDDAQISGTLDTTISYGATFRTEARDSAQAAIGAPDALERRSQVNENDGNVNFNEGLVSSTVKVTSELDVIRENYGIFVRGTAFYDEVIMRGNHDGGNSSLDYENNGYGNNFGEAVKDEVGSKAEILDAYVWGDWLIADRPLNIRLGNQVISWGEALFLQDGVNQVNPASLATLRLPGSEVREALIPLPMLFAQYGLTDNLTLETYYQFEWEPSVADPAGTFLSSDDALAAEGGERVLVNLPASAEALASLYNFYERGITADDVLDSQLTVTRAPTDAPKDQGQFGLALRYFVPALNDTEFGLYYLNFHSHKPVAGAIMGPAFGATVDGSSACLLVQQVINAAPDCSIFADPSLFSPDVAAIIQGANQLYFIDNSQYFRIYEEDNELLGFSFNTSIGNTSFAGELAYRKNAPFLPEDGDNLIAYLASSSGLPANGGVTDFGPFVPDVVAEKTILVVDHKDMFNLSLVAIHSFGPQLGASQLLGVLETGLAYVGGLDDELLYTAEGADLYIPGLAEDGAPDDYLDSTSWGYRLVTRLNYNNVLAGVNLEPTLKFAHDVKGNSIRGGNFLEDRKSATLALKGDYLQSFQFGLSYTWFWGAGLRNYLSDRDHASFNVKYAF